MEPLIRFFGQATRLKTLKRAGWGRCGMEQCESVADHTFGVALLALCLLPKNPVHGIDRDHCVAMALAHDLAESIVGDITPHDAVEPAEKHRREEAAMRELAANLGDDEVLKLWQEFEQGQTEEAKCVRDLDVIEMAHQARVYERSGKLKPAEAARFVDSARTRVQTQMGRKLLNAVLRSGE
jgi:putative hydrolase of HD superfamily